MCKHRRFSGAQWDSAVKKEVDEHFAWLAQTAPEPGAVAAAAAAGSAREAEQQAQDQDQEPEEEEEQYPGQVKFQKRKQQQLQTKMQLLQQLQELQQQQSRISTEQLDAALRSLYGLSEARAAEAAADAKAAEEGEAASPRKRTLRAGDVSWARVLGANLDRLDSWVEWRVLRRDSILPAVARLQESCRKIESVSEWLKVRGGRGGTPACGSPRPLSPRPRPSPRTCRPTRASWPTSSRASTCSSSRCSITARQPSALRSTLARRRCSPPPPSTPRCLLLSHFNALHHAMGTPPLSPSPRRCCASCSPRRSTPC